MHARSLKLILDPDKQTFREFVSSLAGLQGLSIEKLRSMPYWLASAIGRAMDTIWAFTRREDDPPISRSMMRMIGREFVVSDAAARCELGYVGKVSRTEGLQAYNASSLSVAPKQAGT